jgi:hypothetical protein
MLVEDVFTNRDRSPRTAALKLQQAMADYPLDLHITLAPTEVYGKAKEAGKAGVRLSYTDTHGLVKGWVDLLPSPTLPEEYVVVAAASGSVFSGEKFDIPKIFKVMQRDFMFKVFEQQLKSALGVTSIDQRQGIGEDNDYVAHWDIFPPFNLPGHQVYDQYIVSHININITTHSTVRVWIYDVNGDDAAKAEATDLHEALKEAAEAIKQMTPDDMQDPSHNLKPYKRF